MLLLQSCIYHTGLERNENRKSITWQGRPCRKFPHHTLLLSPIRICPPPSPLLVHCQNYKRSIATHPYTNWAWNVPNLFMELEAGFRPPYVYTVKEYTKAGRSPANALFTPKDTGSTFIFKSLLLAFMTAVLINYWEPIVGRVYWA